MDSSSDLSVISHDLNSSQNENKKNVAKSLEKWVNKGSKNNLKNLYQNIGTRVSKLREVNDVYQKKIKNQKEEMNKLDEEIKKKEQLLNEIRDAKSKNNNEFFKKLKQEGNIKLTMDITINHIKNDPELNKIIKKYENQCGELKNKLNSLHNNTESIRKNIDTLRLENLKLNQNLQDLMVKKEIQTKEMDIISEEANKYLVEKGNINKNIMELNEKIDNQKEIYETKMEDLNKMIDNTKRIKEFHETLALEKFAKTSYNKKNQFSSNQPTTKLVEEEKKLEDLNKELKKKKRQTVYLNFSRLILLKKQKELNNIIEKVKSQTGIENLDKLSEYLEISSKTNKLFETDLKKLTEHKEGLEQQIQKVKEEIQQCQCILMDTSSKKENYQKKLMDELKKEEEKKISLNKKFHSMNILIDILSKVLKNLCINLKYNETDPSLETESKEKSMMKYMDFLEKKLIEIIQLNTDNLKEDIIIQDNDNENLKNINKMLEKITKLDKESAVKFLETKKPKEFSYKDIKESAEEFINVLKKKV